MSRRALSPWLLAPALLPFVFFLPRITGGGWTVDDWSNRQNMVASPFGDAWAGFFDEVVGHRVLHIPYVSLYDAALGGHETLYLIWMVLTACVLAVLVALLLMRLGVPAWASAATGTLGTLFPYSTITKIWFTAHVAHIGIGLAVVGLLLAIRGLGSERRGRRVAWHAAALVAFFVALQIYELGLPLIAASGIFYGVALHAAGQSLKPRAVLSRWAADLALTGLWALKVMSDGPAFAEKGDRSQLERIEAVFTDGTQVLLGAFFPFLADERSPTGQVWNSGAHFSPTEGLLCLALVVGFAAALIAAPRFSARSKSLTARSLRFWGLGIAAGLVVGFASWVAIIPANDYYRPVPLDAGANRINAMAGYGLAGAVVATAGALGLLAALIRHRRANYVGIGLTTLLLIAVLTSYVRHNRTEIRTWNEASTEQRRILDRVRAAYGGEAPASGTTVFLTDNKTWIGDGAEVFYSSWTFESALRLTFGDRTLEGRGHRVGALYACQEGGLAAYYLQYRQGRGDVPRYGQVDLVSVEQQRVWHIDDRKSCERSVPEAGLSQPAPDFPLPALGET